MWVYGVLVFPKTFLNILIKNCTMIETTSWTVNQFRWPVWSLIDVMYYVNWRHEITLLGINCLVFSTIEVILHKNGTLQIIIIISSSFCAPGIFFFCKFDSVGGVTFSCYSGGFGLMGWDGFHCEWETLSKMWFKAVKLRKQYDLQSGSLRQRCREKLNFILCFTRNTVFSNNNSAFEY